MKTKYIQAAHGGHVSLISVWTVTASINTNAHDVRLALQSLGEYDAY